MKNKIFAQIAVFFLISALWACSNSKKGNWDEKDKKAFQEKCRQEAKKQGGAGLEDKLCNCLQSKYEQNYASATDVPKEEEKKIGKECADEAIKEMGL